tara:strand:- start:257 stop:445 length:189 start_codon:yes stop_codon:yes gene_type:complete
VPVEQESAQAVCHQKIKAASAMALKERVGDALLHRSGGYSFSLRKKAGHYTQSQLSAFRITI